MTNPHIFAGNPLNRGEAERRDEDWLKEKARNLTSKFLPMSDLNVLITEDAEPEIGWLGLDDLTQMGADVDAVFLGLMDGTAYFAVDISKDENAVNQLQSSANWRFEDARTAAELLAGPDAGIIAQARAQINWHNRNGFCSVCGNKTVKGRGGQIRRCTACETEHYPRTDPVIITVVTDNDRCLLGQSRGRLSRMKMYSALAGFVDQGESIEEAVAREIMEEAGIRVKNVRYHSSQPWPFPSSLMIGCHADAATTDIVMDTEEMSDVQWFERKEVLLALEGNNDKLSVPGPIAIAHHLIKAWATNERIQNF